MTAKFIALILAAAVLAACETAKPPEAEVPSPSAIASPVQKRVVHGPIVPDDEPVVAASRARAAPARAPAAAPQPAVAAAAVKTAKTVSEAAAEAVTGTPAAESAPAIGETSSSVSVAELPPPAAPAQPAATQPAGPSWLQELPIGDMKNMMNASIGGFPLWLMVLIGLVLAAALVFGMGGRREAERESYAEPA